MQSGCALGRPFPKLREKEYRREIPSAAAMPEIFADQNRVAVGSLIAEAAFSHFNNPISRRTAFCLPFFPTTSIHQSCCPFTHTADNKALNLSRNRRSSIAHMSTPSTESIKPKSIPQSVRDANVVIVGGGPCGSLAAMKFHQRGMSTTLIERVSDFTQFDLSKAYPMGIFGRGLIPVDSVPGLKEYIAQFTLPSQISKFTFIGIDSKLSSFQNSSLAPRNSLLMLFRFRLLQVFKSFVQERTDAVTMYGTTVTFIDFKDDGSMDVHIEDATSTQVLNTRLILACDGKNSAVLKQLREAEERSAGHGSNIHTIRGLAEKSFPSPSVGMTAMSVLVNRHALDKFNIDVNPEDEDIIRVNGLEKGRSIARSFSLTLWPSNKKFDTFDGVLGLITQFPEHDLWKLKTVDEAVELFQENFPQLDIREAISLENMKDFVESTPVKFPMITRPESIVATVGKSPSGGVVMIGDSAHCFPPNLGLGVNSGFEDISIFTRIIDEADPTDSVMKIVKRYEQNRDEDISALMKISQKCSPFVMSDPRPLAKLWMFVISPLRNKLTTWFPSVLYPSCVKLTRTNLSFSEIWRRGQISMFRIYAAIFSIICIPIAAYVVHMLY